MKTTTTTHSPEGCPVCLTKLDAATGAGQRRPKVGSLGVCVYCTALLIYGDGLTLRQLSEEEFKKLSPEQQAELRSVQNAYRQNPIVRR